MLSFPELRTKRLLLRAMELDDTEGYAELLSDARTYPFITESGPVPTSEVPDRIRRNREAFQTQRHVYWSVELSGQFIGYVALHGPSLPTPALSYAIRPAWRRQNLAREALQAVCDFCISTLNKREVVAHSHLDNRASAQLLRSLGFREIGSVPTRAGDRREFRLSAA